SSSETFHIEVNWGDVPGVQSMVVSGGSFTGLNHRYQNQPGMMSSTYTVTVTLLDDDAGSTVSTTSVTVANLPPAVQSFAVTAGVNALNQGMKWHPITFDLTFTDASWAATGGDTVSAMIDWDGDGSYDDTLTDANAVPVGSDKKLTVTHIY